MAKTTWYGDGIYSKERSDRDGRPCQAFFVRAWIPSEKRLRVFKAGRTIKSAERLRLRILADPDAAVAKREQQAAAAGALTVAELHKTFTCNYRSRGGTDYYTTVLHSFIEAFGKTQASTVTLEKIDAYFRKRRSQRWADGRPRIGDSTIRKECIAAGKMFKWARYRGLVPFNPFLEYEKPREPAGPPARALTYEEEDAIAALLPPLERDTFLFALDSGMRIGEIRALTWPRVDRAAGVIHVDGTKTGKLRTVPLSLSDRLPAILDRHPQRTTTALLFHDLDGKPLERDRLNRLLRVAMKAAGVPKFKGSLWNATRKTCVSRLYDAGARPQDEADWLGHSMAVADKHYREHSRSKSERSDGLLNRPATVARTVARQASIA